MIKKLSAKRDCREMDNSEIIEAILEDRGVEDLTEFLHPSEYALIPLEELKNIHEAYTIIDDGILMGSKFGVLFDSADCDGQSSGAIMTRYLRACGAEVKPIINIGKAHGFSQIDLSLLDDVDICIVVDSLDNNPEIYRNVLNKVESLVVLDHHIIEQRLIDADLPFVLVSSANNYPNPQLSGSGVTLKMCLYLDSKNGTNYADNLWVYACLGLQSDMCSMASPENRYIMSRGLVDFKNPLIKAMVGTYMFNTESISFSVAPLVNSCARVRKNEIATNAFLTDDEDEIVEFVKQMKECKEEQNKVVDSLINELTKQAEVQLNNKAMYFILPEVDAEIAGLLANRLLSTYQRPLFVIKDCGDKWMGSMRAIGVASMLDIVNGTGIAKCSGHELAAGFECDKDKFEDFKTKIEEVLADIEFTTECVADIEIEPSQVNEALIKSLNALNRISGAGWPAVTVLMRTNNYEVSTFTSKKHTKIIDNKTGVLFTKWNCLDYQTMDNKGEIVGVGTLSNSWYGRKQFQQLTLDEYTQQND